MCPAPVAAARWRISACGAGIHLISHGLPHPENIEVARGAEAAVRAAGAEPATMAVIDGRPHAGLDNAAMERLATEGDVKKLSRRDLPVALSGAAGAPALGATTVSATMILARLAGIEVLPPAASAVCIAGSRPAWMSPPTCSNWRIHR